MPLTLVVWLFIRHSDNDAFKKTKKRRKKKIVGLLL